MRVGITGHQKGAGIDWKWVGDRIRLELQKLHPPLEGVSSLAEGADQVFAQAILDFGGSLRSIIPTPKYERFFSDEGLRRYRRLKLRSRTENLDPARNDEASFFKAGQYIADNTDILLAVWDGRPADGVGGTADVVSYALERGKVVIHIDPISRTVRRLTH